MAIVKAHFTRRTAEIKETLWYIIHRPNREEERLTRVLFGNGDREYTKEEAYELIDSQKGSVYFHVILNFDQQREDTRRDLDLRAITRQTFATLEERLARPVRFLAVEHNDHTELRHIHAIAMVKLARGERVLPPDWKACREAITQYIRLERTARDLLRGYQNNLHRGLSSAMSPVNASRVRHSFFDGHEVVKGRARRVRFARSVQPARSCADCGYKQPMVRRKDGKTYYCRTCGKVEEASPKLRREQEQELALGV